MDIDIEISNLSLEHINKIYYVEGDCLFDTIAHLLKYLKKKKKNKTSYIYNSSLEILMALSLKNSNLSVEEPKFYIMKNLHSLNITLKQAYCKNWNLVVNILYTCYIFVGKQIKGNNHAILFSQLIAHK